MYEDPSVALDPQVGPCEKQVSYCWSYGCSQDTCPQAAAPALPLVLLSQSPGLWFGGDLLRNSSSLGRRELGLWCQPATPDTCPFYETMKDKVVSHKTAAPGIH